MTTKALTFLCAGAVSAILSLGSAAAQEKSADTSHATPGESANTKAFMRQKLAYANNALEGLTLERYDLVIENARLMRNMTQSNIFLRIQHKEYVKRTAEFSRSIDRLIKAAARKKLSTSTRALNKVTQSCVECHRWFRTEQRPHTGDPKAPTLYFKAAPKRIEEAKEVRFQNQTTAPNNASDPMKKQPSTKAAVLKKRTRTATRLKPPSPARFKLKKILVPIDFSDCALQALHYAIPFANQFNCSLVLIHVCHLYDWGTAGGPLDRPVIERDIVAESKQHLNDLEKREIKGQAPSTINVRTGRPATEIINAARELKIDLIILSTHGFSGLARAWFGSTAEEVIRQAPCPVLAVRDLDH